MQQWIDLNNKIVNDNLATLKQLGELNAKATESLLAQQKDIVEGYTATASENIEKLKAVKEPKDFLEMQSEMFQNSMTFALGNWNKVMNAANANSDSYKKFAEKSLKTAKTNMEKAVETVKQSAEEAQKAVKTATKAK